MTDGAWSPVHATLTEPLSYGDEQTYVLAAWWLRSCSPVEDWGCGGGGFSRYLAPIGENGRGSRYRGVDSSGSPYASVTADLRGYRSETPGILLRHVLEHNDDWRVILDNAVMSFTERLCVVLFTPLVGTTHQLATEDAYGGAPVWAFALDDLRAPLLAAGITHDVAAVASPWAHYGVETLIYAQR